MNNNIQQNQTWEAKVVSMLNAITPGKAVFFNAEFYSDVFCLPDSTMCQEEGDIIIHDIHLDNRHFMGVTTGNTHLIIRMS